jgi:sigma-70-like protein
MTAVLGTYGGRLVSTVRPGSRTAPAVALARHFRDGEGLSIAQIAERLGRSPETVKAYFYDPSKVTKRL